MDPRTYEFGDFCLETGSRRLLRSGVPVAITVKAFDTLAALVEQAGRVVDKDELMRRIWSDAIVEEANLSQQIFLVRKALGDNAEDHRFIATVPRRGYRFVANIMESREAASASISEDARATPPSFAEVGVSLKLALPLAPGPPLALGPCAPFALSPDGRVLVYTARRWENDGAICETARSPRCAAAAAHRRGDRPLFFSRQPLDWLFCGRTPAQSTGGGRIAVRHL